MTWGRAAEHGAKLEKRLAVVEDELASLRAQVNAVEEDRITLADLINRRTDEAADRLAALTRRIEILEASRDDAAEADPPIGGARLAEVLLPLKLEIAALAHQAAVDECQMQRAYLELVAQMEQIRKATLSMPPPPQRPDCE